MSLLPLTLSIGLCLVFTLLVFFLRDQARRPAASTERDSRRPAAGRDEAMAD